MNGRVLGAWTERYRRATGIVHVVDTGEASRTVCGKRIVPSIWRLGVIEPGGAQTCGKCLRYLGERERGKRDGELERAGVGGAVDSADDGDAAEG